MLAYVLSHIPTFPMYDIQYTNKYTCHNKFEIESFCYSIASFYSVVE